jgi:hypothetical protein
VIPRYQAVLFVALLAASAAMGVVLWQLRDRAHRRLLAGEDSTPTHAPEVAPLEQATLMVANNADGSLETRELELPLPPNPDARARAVLGKLLELYAARGAAHPVPGGATSIQQVFLLPATARDGAATNGTGGETTSASAQSGSELAVVNLTDAFAANHPSGLETETLTILSISATLHANLPRVTEVRFLVDGEQRATLAGHADLSRIYLATDAEAAEGTQP